VVAAHEVRPRHHLVSTEEVVSMRRLSVTAFLLLATACVASRNIDRTGELYMQLGDAINDLRIQSGDMQQQIDSLRTVVARQDSVIRQLANLAGVQMRP
jgi:hypothetical protein